MAEGERGHSRAFDVIRTFLPCMLGIACARVGILAVGASSYTQTDDGLFSDGPNLIKSILLVLMLILLARRSEPLAKRTVYPLALTCMVLEGISALGIWACSDLGVGGDVMLLICAIINSLGGTLAIFYWLRWARGVDVGTAVVFVFTARAISEGMLYGISLCPDAVQHVLAAILSVIPIALIGSARKMFDRSDADFKARISDKSVSHEYSHAGFDDTGLSSANAVGLVLMAIVIGLLRGYPDGNPIAFTPGTQVAYVVVSVVALVTFALTGLRTGLARFSVILWVVMQACAAMAIVLYASMPDALPYGAVFAMVLNSLFGTFKWLLTVALMSQGRKDGYFYAILVYLLMLLPRSIARVAMIVLPGGIMPDVPDSVVLALLFLALVASMQVVFVKLIGDAARRASVPVPEAQTQPTAFEKALSLDASLSYTDYRDQTLRRNAEEIGANFNLTEREIDVLALYASGKTQRRIAEELVLAESTVHSYIKNVYAKTGMHSR